MATVFAITTATDALKLEPGTQAEAVFTVTNNTSRPLRGMAKLKPLGETKLEWLKLAGETERDLAAGGTQQFTVAFNPPADLQPGKYSFRLDVVSTANPDEDFTEGPTVTAESLPPKPKPPSKAWIIPVALIAVLAIVVLVVWLLSGPRKIKVPGVVGQTIEQAREMLKTAGLKISQETQVPADTPGQVGTVKSAAPAPGEKVAVDSSVALEVYGPPAKVTVRDVTGKTLDEAKAILEGEQHLVVAVSQDQKATLDFPEGAVAEQDPIGGTPSDAGGTVTLKLTGKTVKVPVGLTGRPALAAATAVSLAKLSPIFDGDDTDGAVESVRPGEGEPELVGTIITLRIPCKTFVCKYRRSLGKIYTDPKIKVVGVQQ